MAEESDATTRQQVLDLIVEKGPVTASSIAKVLGLTTAAVRRHITLLLDSKEIAEHEPSAPSKRGRGRPARHYVATERAHVHLADGYSDLASKALGYLGQLGGDEAVESFAAARSREIELRPDRTRRGLRSPGARPGARRCADAGWLCGHCARYRRWNARRAAVPGPLPDSKCRGRFPAAVRCRDACLRQAAGRPRPTTFHACWRRTRVHNPHSRGYARDSPWSAERATKVALG